MTKHALALALLLFGNAATGWALSIETDAVFVRVIDTGPGLATVTRMPGDRYMVYDAGHWNHVSKVMKAIKGVIPSGQIIDLLVLSHGDSDHIAAVEELLDEYDVQRIIWTGDPRDSGTWSKTSAAIKKAREGGRTRDINLGYYDFPMGATYRYGDAYVTMVAGFHQPPDHWDIQNDSEHNNAISIIIRLWFRGKSVLFTGDTVGRHSGDPDDDALIAAEQFMVENAPVINIDSDVMIAPHHGADNGSSKAFIKAVSPQYVIFSAGSEYGHPRATTAARYLSHGVAQSRIFRTDIGDDEGGSHGADEWKKGATAAGDKVGDDDIDILIRPNGQVLVQYRTPH